MAAHLSIYLTGLDELYREQAAQLKQQVHRAEKATQELDGQRTRAARAEYSLATLQAQMQEYEARRGIGGWIEEEEEEPEEPQWDVGTQTEEEVLEETHWDIGTQTEEEEPEETHWDKGTQTEDDVMDQCLPLKKRPIRIE